MSLSANPLHLQLAERILRDARISGLPVGHHFTEASLQPVFGTSRGPIRAALTQLARKGFVEKRPNKGFFLKRLPGEGINTIAALPVAHDVRLYLAIAADRLAGELPDVVTEAALMRRYREQRHRVVGILGRISAEGWAERRPGHGWSFLPVIDSLEAYQESYELRRVLEPAGILSADFPLDRQVLAQLRQQQEFIHSEGHRTLGPIELFETNSRFHETIAGMSGNRFLAQAIVRQNQLRRLIEYRQTVDRNRIRRQSAEHLDIIEKLGAGDRLAAAELMEAHISGAGREKTKAEVFHLKQSA